MQTEIRHTPSFGSLFVTLGPEDSLLCQGGAMVSMSEGTEVETRMIGGFFRALLRRLFGGVSMFLNRFRNPTGGELVLAPRIPGDLVERTLQGERLMVEAGSFLAAIGDVKLRPRFMGFRALFSGEGVTMLEVSGDGTIFIPSYGGIVEHHVSGSYVVDTGHVVAFEPTLDYKIRSVGGFKSLLFSGEGLVMEFHGEGKLYLQTRSLTETVSWIRPFLPR